MARWDQVIRISRAIEERFNISAAVRSNGMLYLSGMTAINDAMEVIGPGDMEAQIQRIYDRLQNVLAAAGLTLADVVCEVAYTTDIVTLGRSAHVRDRCYRQANAAPPAVTAVEVSRLYFAEAMVELVATAELKS